MSKKMTIGSLCTLALLAACAGPTKAPAQGPANRMAESRASYYRSIREGLKPSVESVRDFLLPAELDRRDMGALKRERYFRDVMPYFFGGLTGEGIQWTEENVKATKEQRDWCMDKKAKVQREQAELDATLKSAPVGQYGQRVFPQAQYNKTQSVLGVIPSICMGVDPTGFHGNQVWLSMEASKAVKLKGGF